MYNANQMHRKVITNLDINGEAPELKGTICNAFICEQFVCESNFVASANVTYLKFSSVWHRLYFDCGIIFWRIESEKPLPWSVPEEQWSYLHTDVGSAAGVVGQMLTFYTMKPTPTGSKVEFIFSSDRRIILEDYNDISSYVIV